MQVALFEVFANDYSDAYYDQENYRFHALDIEWTDLGQYEYNELASAVDHWNRQYRTPRLVLLTKVNPRDHMCVQYLQEWKAKEEEKLRKLKEHQEELAAKKEEQRLRKKQKLLEKLKKELENEAD